MRPLRIFLVGWYGVPNLGDEAIFQAIEAAAPARSSDDDTGDRSDAEAHQRKEEADADAAEAGPHVPVDHVDDRRDE